MRHTMEVLSFITFMTAIAAVMVGWTLLCFQFADGGWLGLVISVSPLALIPVAHALYRDWQEHRDR